MSAIAETRQRHSATGPGGKESGMDPENLIQPVYHLTLSYPGHVSFPLEEIIKYLIKNEKGK